MRNQCDVHRSVGPFIGRLLISLIFILAGLGKILDYSGGVASLREMGIQGAQVYIVVGLLMELLGGISILLGWYTRLGCWLLMIFLLPTTLIFHGFWNYEGPAQALQLSLFLKNLTLYGGLILLASYGPGRFSVDARRCPHLSGE